MLHAVGIAEMKTSDQKDDVLITYALGSCLGLSLYDPTAGVGGLLHSMLPLSRTNPEKASARPHMFTDTGVALLIQELIEMGAKKNEIVARVAGGSRIMDSKGMFKIGERNYTVMRKVLWKNSILIAAEDVGGTSARTMTLRMADGATMVKAGGLERTLE